MTKFTFAAAKIVVFALLLPNIAPAFADPSKCSTLKWQEKALRERGAGPLLIVSGPSGAGKTTVLKRVLAESGLPLRTAVAVTTRAPRPGEVDGVNYHFWTKERFAEASKRNSFLEAEEVHGNFYGTLRSEVEPYRAKGTGVILVIDVQGAKKIREKYSDVVAIFLKTSSLSEYERRLRARGTETEESIKTRVTNAAKELENESAYDIVVLNDNLDQSVGDMSKVLSEQFGRPGKKL